MREGAHQEPVVWQLVEWRQGDGRYRFEVQQGGLHATLTTPHGGSLTAPMVGWYGLIDALAASRKTRERSERAMPPRSNARWSREELGDLLAAYRTGATIRTLAQAHNRSEQAIEAQLSREGLWDRLRREPIERLAGTAGPVITTGQAGTAGPASTTGLAASMTRRRRETVAPWPADYWDSPASVVPTPPEARMPPVRSELPKP